MYVYIYVDALALNTAVRSWGGAFLAKYALHMFIPISIFSIYLSYQYTNTYRCPFIDLSICISIDIYVCIYIY